MTTSESPRKESTSGNWSYYGANSLPLDSQRTLHVKNASHHVVECPLDTWFATFISATDIKWSQGSANEVKNLLLSNRPSVLDANGWVQIRNHIVANSSENIMFSAMQDVSQAVIDCRCTFGGISNADIVTNFHVTPDTVSRPDVEGSAPRPDGRNTIVRNRLEPLNLTELAASPRRSNRGSAIYWKRGDLLSDITSHCAAIWEFKKGYNDKTSVLFM